MRLTLFDENYFFFDKIVKIAEFKRQEFGSVSLGNWYGLKGESAQFKRRICAG